MKNKTIKNINIYILKIFIYIFYKKFIYIFYKKIYFIKILKYCNYKL